MHINVTHKNEVCTQKTNHEVVLTVLDVTPFAKRPLTSRSNVIEKLITRILMLRLIHVLIKKQNTNVLL